MNAARARAGTPRLEFTTHSATHQRAIIWGGVYGDSTLYVKYSFMPMFPGGLAEAVGVPETTWDIPSADDDNTGDDDTGLSADARPITTDKSGKLYGSSDIYPSLCGLCNSKQTPPLSKSGSNSPCRWYS